MSLASRFPLGPCVRSGLQALATGLACVWAPVLGAPVDDGEGAAVWIERLGASEARVRERAQRWLAAQLSPADLPLVVAALRSGDPEVQLRLTDALAADDRRLGLAAALFVDVRPPVRDAGRAALIQMLAAWCPGCEERGWDRGRVRAALEARPPVVLRMQPGVLGPLAHIERLGRLGGLGVPLAVDPHLGELVPRPHAGGTGTALELLEGVLGTFDLELEGFGFEERGEPGPAAWIHVTRRGLADLATGRELLMGGVLRVQTGGAEAPAAARLLAASGWPAALGWLGERWARGDEGVLDGLLEVAAQGRVVSALCTPEGQRRILERADALLAAGGAGARGWLERGARALAGTGPLGPGGEDLDGLLLGADPASLAPAALWLRLVALEGRRGGSPRVRPALVGLAARPDLSPALRLGVLRALAAQAPPTRAEDAQAGPAPAGIEELARWAAETGRGPELARLAARLGWDPPASLARGSGSEPSLTLLVADWWHARGEPELGAELLAGVVPLLAQDPDSDARVLGILQAWNARLGADVTRRVLEPQLVPAPPDGSLARLAVRAGALSAERQRLLLEALVGDTPAPEELALLGHLAAGPGGVGVRSLLLDRLQTAVGGEPSGVEVRALTDALSAAASALARTRQDPALAIFVREVGRRAPSDRTHPLSESLAPDRWPPPARAAPDSLDELDRTLEGIGP